MKFDQIFEKVYLELFINGGSKMKIPLTKRVSMIELFYDLVFAYMISQATSLIHHLNHGMISPICNIYYCSNCFY